MAKAKKVTDRAFVVVDTDGQGRPRILSDTLSYVAKDLRRRVGSWFDDDNPETGWKTAKKAGYRVCRCTITLD